MTRPLPPSASRADPGAGDRLVAPSATRNADAICDLLARVAPERGRALELASGTGQHIVRFAARMPELTWTPSEPDAARRASIRAYAGDAGLGNLCAPRNLDACAPGWGTAEPEPSDLIVLINLLHLIGADEAAILIAEAGNALAPGGCLVLYGPFRREGALVSTADADFDAALRAADPRIGYKNDAQIVEWIFDAGLRLDETVRMPANNLAFVARRAAA
ncbi:MAG: class I SAM-dependent methyltransferase [Rhodobacteraceae bacterium]|nr:class I SAM-dependent methyltransferase [Paracoccaceae bacterium]